MAIRPKAPASKYAKKKKKYEKKRREMIEENQLLTNLLKSQSKIRKKANPFNTIVNS